jgi:hypothetical protein
MPRGAKPGERRGGRRKGTPNKTTAEIKALAAEHVPAIVKELVRLATKAKNEATRVAAGKELLDRAFGKAPQALIGDPTKPFTARIGVVGRTIDAPPAETREEWFARRYRELGVSPPVVAGPTNGRDHP